MAIDDARCATLFGSDAFVQSSFCLHNLSVEARRRCFARLAAADVTLALVEFDCDAELLAPAQRFGDAAMRYFFETYCRGVDEYNGSRPCDALTLPEQAAAIDGFLMPVRAFAGRAPIAAKCDSVLRSFKVLFGAFDGASAMPMHEQSAAAWRAELSAAGFARIETRRVASYWWAPCVLLLCRTK